MRILVVDDMDELRNLIGEYLEKAIPGVEVFYARSGKQAATWMEEFQDHKLDAIISDFNMPGGNGNLVLEMKNKQDLEIPFLFFTSEDLEPQIGCSAIYDKNSMKQMVNELAIVLVGGAAVPVGSR